MNFESPELRIPPETEESPPEKPEIKPAKNEVSPAETPDASLSERPEKKPETIAAEKEVDKENGEDREEKGRVVRKPEDRTNKVAETPQWIKYGHNLYSDLLSLGPFRIIVERTDIDKPKSKTFVSVAVPKKNASGTEYRVSTLRFRVTDFDKKSRPGKLWDQVLRKLGVTYGFNEAVKKAREWVEGELGVREILEEVTKEKRENEGFAEREEVFREIKEDPSKLIK